MTVTASAETNPKSHPMTELNTGLTHRTANGLSAPGGHPFGASEPANRPVTTPATMVDTNSTTIQRRTVRDGEPVGHPSSAIARAGRMTFTASVRSGPHLLGQ